MKWRIKRWKGILLALGAAGVLVRCASTEVFDSPRTTFIPEAAPAGEPKIFWTSRTLSRPFDYLGKIKVKAWSDTGGIAQILEGAKTLHADAVTDIHSEPAGFLTTMEAFAIKFR